MPHKILLIDDHKLFLQGLKTLLEGAPEFQVVGVGHDGREALRMVKELSPDVVIMDVDMPTMDGIEATKTIIAEGLDCKVVALSMHDSKHHVLHMLEAGALGYILKDTLFEDLVKAVTVVASGESYLSPKIASVVIREMSKQQKKQRSTMDALTTREVEVLKCLAEGKRSKEIGSELYISDKTVENHRKNIMTKLDLHNVADLTKFAIRNKITDL